MSPLWRDEVGIYVSPNRITLARMKRGVRPQCINSHDAAVVGERTGGWEASIGVLGGCLVDPTWNHATCRIVLGNHWIRYAMVPWSDALGDADERILHARHCLAKIYGDVVSQWCVTLNEAPPGRAQVACAIPAALLDEVRRHTESNGLKIRSIQPQLVAAFNGWRTRLPAAEGWFVTLEGGSLAAAHLSRGVWDGVRAVRTDRQWNIELKRLQTESRLAGRENDPVYVDGPLSLRSAVPADGIEWLEASSSDDTAPSLRLLKRMYA